MAWDQISVTKPHLVYIILGGFTSLFMLCSTVIKERMYIGEATVATLCGLIFGPHAAGLISPESWGNTDIVTIEFSRLVLVVQCFAVGVELPKFYMERHWRSVTFLLLPVMTFGWLITSLFVWWMIPPLDWLESLVVAACVTATDPVLASSVVGKGKFAKRVPKHLRDLLSAESGCNDGMAFPFIYLSLYLILEHRSARDVTFHWIVYTILYECVFGAFYGFMIGYLARHGIKYAERHELIDRESFLVFYFVLALFCAGSGSILGLDDLLVGFACGVGFSNDGWFTQKTEESHVSNVIDLLLNLAYFVYLGTIIPWEQFNNTDIGLSAWRLSVLAILVIFFRRIPIMMLLKPVIPDIKTWREALFAGHFGPIGVGAIFVAILARAELESENPVPLAELPEPGTENYTLILLVWPIVTFLVVTSILVHGSSVAVFTLGKHINTLTITMSYTQANEDGPSWMNRLPRITSTSRSQARNTSDTEADELKMPEYPPGTLPPVGMPGQFLRRVREDEKDGNRQPSRASSLASRRRSKKKWEDGMGPGGPVSQSAIFPQRRSQSEHGTLQIDAPNQSPPERTKSGLLSATGASVRGRSPIRKRDPEEAERKPGNPKTSWEDGTAPSEDISDRRQRSSSQPEGIEVYDEGDHVIVENEEGEVLAVEPSNPEKKHEHTEAIKDELKKQPHGTGWEVIKQRFGHWRDEEMSKRKEKEKSSRRHEPARAYQFGNTVIVEDEDGEVVKQYVLPVEQTDRQDGAPGTSRQWGLPRRTTGGEASTQRPARPRKKSVVDEREEEDDRQIRFTIGGVGQRMTKEDFIQEMRKFDKPTRKDIVEKLEAPSAVKMLLERQEPSPNRDALRPHAREDTGETPAERRRREAALGTAADSDSDDDDTQRVPRGIRFADAPERGH